jgi:thymidylate kinase
MLLSHHRGAYYDFAGMLIAVEGPSTSGKGTLIAGLEAALAQRGIEAHDVFAHALGIDGAEARLKEFVANAQFEIDPVEELLLYGARMAARMRLALALDRADNVVLLDRHQASLMVLTHHVRGLDAALVEQIAAVASRGGEVRGTLFLDVDERGWRERGGEARYGRKQVAGVEFFAKTRRAFAATFEAERRPKLWIDTAAANADECVGAALAFIMELRET